VSSSVEEQSAALFDRLADRYDELFAAPHRKAYDDLAWRWVSALLPERPGVVVDAGCGVGRWAARIVERGHRVIGVDSAPAMAGAARARAAQLGGRFTVLAASMSDVELPAASADLVLAMGSLQYTKDPAAVVARFVTWLRPGGAVAILVDSLVALVMERVRDGDVEDAEAMMASRRGTWRHGGEAAALRLLDRAELTAMLVEAGLVDVRSHGLLVSAGVNGVPFLVEALAHDGDAQWERELRLSAVPDMADLGKHLLVTGRKP
jgi:SAM-dependent methyltransferase